MYSLVGNEFGTKNEGFQVFKQRSDPYFRLAHPSYRLVLHTIHIQRTTHGLSPAHVGQNHRFGISIDLKWKSCRWLAVISWGLAKLLRTYITEEPIDEATDTLKSLRQMPKETDYPFPSCIGNASYRYENVHSDPEKISIFVIGYFPS